MTEAADTLGSQTRGRRRVHFFRVRRVPAPSEALGQQAIDVFG